MLSYPWYNILHLFRIFILRSNEIRETNEKLENYVPWNSVSLSALPNNHLLWSLLRLNTKSIECIFLLFLDSCFHVFDLSMISHEMMFLFLPPNLNEIPLQGRNRTFSETLIYVLDYSKKKRPFTLSAFNPKSQYTSQKESKRCIR